MTIFFSVQIRKMIGLAIDVFRGSRPMDVFDRCFEPSEKVHGSVQLS